MSEKKLFEEFPPVSTEEWEKVIERDLKGANYKEKLNWQTGEGIEALPFYRKEDQKQKVQSLLPAEHQWKICQTIYETNVEKANEVAKKAVAGGANALWFSVSMESIGGNIGPDMSGTAVQSQDDFSKLLADISLKETELHFNTGMLSPVFVAMLFNECEKRGVVLSEITGSFSYDPFSFILKHSRLPNDKETIGKELKQMTSFCEEHLPNVKTIAVNGAIFREAGATIVQELGYSMAAGSEYLALFTKKSNKDEASRPPESSSNSLGRFFPPSKGKASNIHFNFSTAGNYFLEIAKLRAVRKLWPQVLKAYEVDQSAPTFIYAETSKWNKSTSEPYTNIIRETTEAMAAAVGGCDAITVNPFDENADEFSQRIARNIPLILKEEAYFDKVSDPSAGSWYVETLTDKIAEAAWNVFQEVEQQGGLLESIKEGTLQIAIAESRKEKAAAVENGERVFVGVNKYINSENDGKASASSNESTFSMKQTKSGAKVDSENLISSIKKAFSGGATIGDIAPALFNLSNVQIEPLNNFHIE